MRRRVRDAATVAIDGNDFFARLTSDGAVTVRLRESSRHPGEITGYAVNLAGDTTATGEPIFYRGGRLAADLSLTRLRQRWQPDTTLGGSDRRARQLRPVPAEVYERAAADLLTATAAAWEGTAGGPLTRAAELFDRAAHEYTPIAPATAGSGGYPLRTIARLLAATSSTGRHREQRELKAMLRLVRAMAGPAAAVADLRDAQRRLHQAEAARKAATHLTTYRPPIAATVGAAADDAMALPHVVLPVLAPVRPTGHGR